MTHIGESNVIWLRLKALFGRKVVELDVDTVGVSNVKFQW